MKNIYLLLFIGSFLLSNNGFGQNYSKAKIYIDDNGLQQLAELGIPVDHGSYKKNTFFISDFSEDEIALIKANGFSVDILIPDVKKFYVERSQQLADKAANTCPEGTQVDNASVYPVPTHFTLGSMADYYTYDECIAILDQMAAAYPNLITVKDTISTFLSHENRPIYYVKISDNPNTQEAEPEVLYSSIHHAREPMCLTSLIYYMWYLLENYSTNTEVKYLIDNTQMYFVPLVNPDGYRYNQTTDPNGGGMWRKNRKNNGDGTYGVDNNRNYSYGWNTTGTSQTHTDETYCGTSAFSEPENQAMRWFNENHNFKFAMNGHTYGNTILHPIGTTIAEYADHHDYLEKITHYMASENNYLAQKSSGLYPASGDSDDYMYKVDVGVGMKDTVFSMTTEIGTDNDGFWPASNRILPLAQENVFANLVLSHLTHKFAIVKNTDVSTIDSLTGNFDFTIQRLGLENGTITVSVNPLQGIQSVGSPIPYNLLIRQLDSGMVSYTLNPTIQFGDTVRYELLTDNGLWIRRDTIIRTYGTGTTQLSDSANTTSNWTGSWNTTTESYYSPSQSFTDSPNQNYGTNTTKTYKLTNSVDLTGASSVMARFYAHWDIETDYDYTAFEVSTDAGSTWQQLCGKYTNPGMFQDNGFGQNGGIQPVGEPIYDGTQLDWVQEEVNLNDFIGQTIQLRFKLQSDAGVNQDGFYFDDFKLYFNTDSSSSAGIKKNKSLAFDVFPNPANDIVTVRFSQTAPEGILLITDFSGRVVKSITLDKTNQEVKLPIADLPQGFYFISQQTNSGISQSQKIIIAR